MANPLRILFLSSEITPFAKTGGLADVASALPKAIKEAGHDIRLFMPKYAGVENRKFVLRRVIRLGNLNIPHGDQFETVNIKASFLPGTKLQVYFLDFPPYFERNELYMNPKTGRDYQDNAERFSLFCRAALEMLKRLHWQPDIIHCNDWQSGLVPVYLKTLYREDRFFKKTQTVFTVHNMAYQGNFSPEKLRITGLPESLFSSEKRLEFYGKLSFLKAGLEFADVITTVSPTYAKEIQDKKEFGCGLEGVVKNRAEDIFGILNGVDYSEWDPAVDPQIPVPYNVKSIARKEQNKIHLQQVSQLPENPDTPLVGSISRFADQKGFDLVLAALDQLMKLGIQYIVLGKGEEKFHRKFKMAEEKYPDRLRCYGRFDNQMAHLLEAGCDMFLMPSRYEPCGLNQLYSLKYGTIPIVRATGGLADTVVDFTTNPDLGTGFTFKKYQARELTRTLQKAVSVFQNKKQWRGIMKRAMHQNFSWEHSSREYIKLYSRLLKKKR